MTYVVSHIYGVNLIQMMKAPVFMQMKFFSEFHSWEFNLKFKVRIFTMSTVWPIINS